MSSSRLDVVTGDPSGDGSDHPNEQRTTSSALSRLHLRPYAYWLAALIAAFVLGAWLGSRGHEPRLEVPPELPTMNQCMAETISSLGLKQVPTIEILGQVRGHCYALIRSQGLLRDYAVREVTFIQQYRANAVLMWMVVAVTLSGVVLAALQLMASLQLASAKRAPVGDQQLTVKRDQIVLKSSITGLFILLISFVFFLTYVVYVFRLEVPDDHGPSSAFVGPTLPMGQLGSPPSLPKN
jgi:hypothetical protein